MQRLIDGWVGIPKWWKGFYITFLVSLIVITVMTQDGPFAATIAFFWASMVAFALWSSEKLKSRMGLTSRPREDTSERDWRRRR